MVSAAVAVCFLAVCLGTGLYWYGETHPTEVFSYKAEKARVYAKKHPDQYLITEEDAGFSKIPEALNEYENEQTWEDKDYHRYEVPADILQKLELKSLGNYNQGKFYITKDLAKEILEYYFEQKIEIVSSESYGRVSIKKEWGHQVIYVNSSYVETCAYEGFDGSENYIYITSDPSDGRVMELSMTGKDEEISLFLKEIFSYFVPETYLTDKEIEDFIKDKEPINHHAKFSMEIKQYDSFEDGQMQLMLRPNGINLNAS